MKHIVNRFDFKCVMAGFFRIIENPDLYHRYKDYLEPNLFYYNDVSNDTTSLRILINSFHDMMKEEKTEKPSLVAFRDYLASYKSDSDERYKNARQMYSQYYASKEIRDRINDEGSFDLFRDYLKIMRFIKHQTDIFDSYNAGDMTSAVEFMGKAINEINELKSGQETLFDPNDLESFLFESANDYSPSLLLGITPIDSSMGGFEERTLNLFMSVTNGGKSMMAHHIIKQAMKQRMHVHITCVEDRPKSFARKLTSCLTGIEINRLKAFSGKNPDKPSTDEREKIKKAQEFMKEFLKVDFIYGQSVEYIHKRKLEYDLDCKIKNKAAPKVDIIDYTGHIAAKSYGDKMYEQMRNAYGQRKDFALETGKICFDFAQVNREGGRRLGDKKSLDATDLAGSYDLAQVCDNIISINRSEFDKTNNAARLKIVKARDGEVGNEFQITTNFAAAQMVKEGSDSIWLTGRPADVISLGNTK